MHGAWPPLAAIAAPLLAFAWASPDDHVGQLATTALIAGSAVTVGRLLAGAAPLSLLKAGIYAMAAVDAWLVFTNRLQPANAVLVTAAPAAGLPQLQSASFGGAGLGLRRLLRGRPGRRHPRGPARSAGLRRRSPSSAASLAWDQLFLVYDVLPATVPPALVLLGCELLRRRNAAPPWRSGRRSPAPNRRSRSEESSYSVRCTPRRWSSGTRCSTTSSNVPGVMA